MSLLVIRHAHAGKRAKWSGDDRLRPLSRKGEKQALGLADALVLHRPERVLASPAVRCVTTVEPLAEQLGLDVERDERLFEHAGEDDVRSLLREVAGTPAALCSHGNVIPEILEQLMAAGMVPDRDLRCKKASTWLIGRSEAGWGSGTYLAPPTT